MLAAWPLALGAVPLALAAEAWTPRTVTPMTGGWQFVQDDGLSDAALASNGAGWTRVELPHAWNARDAAGIAQATPASKDYKRGLGWYRLQFAHAPGAANSWLRFDGASIAADAWLNGQKPGRHRGAFGAFRFDVSGRLLKGPNVLVVKADDRAAVSAFDPTAIAPLSGDFNMSGALYRAVSLVGTPARAHIALDDLGSSGVHVTTEPAAPDTSNIRVVRRQD
ncbi:sugar-binding domain-containing protein [Massilia niastensis]|uniref:sugar-binding domain-containing protein n=1 Tax=Massilia niastensis TaxID=544911 RepID=UPI000366BC5E|nr:sugar-binding domain-containing protein [Massilia niastensis]